MMNKRGSVLAHVLIVVVILYTIAVYSLRSSMSAKMLQAKARNKSQAAGALDAARAQADACLHESGFPVASCSEALPACLPASIGDPAVTIAFRVSGNYAADHYCKLAIDVTLPGE
jgi:type II secretory pathway pseudopilin PulG